MTSSRLSLASTLLLLAVSQAACAEAQQPAAKAPPPKPEVTADGLVRMAPGQECFIDPKNKRVVVKGEVCLREGQLEMLVTLAGTKEHEAVVAVKSKAYLIHA